MGRSLKEIKTIEGFFCYWQERARENSVLEKLGYPECWVMGIKVGDGDSVPRLETLGSGASVASLTVLSPS